MKVRTICRCDEDGPLDGRVWGTVTLYRAGRSTQHLADCPLVREAYATLVDIMARRSPESEKEPKQ